MVSTTTGSSSRPLAFATARMAVVRGLRCARSWLEDAWRNTCATRKGQRRLAAHLLSVDLSEGRHLDD